MATTSSGWTSSTVVPLYLRNAQAASSGGVSGGQIAPQQGGVSSYRYATQGAIPSSTAPSGNVELGPGSPKPTVAPARVFGAEDFRTSQGAGLRDPSLGSVAYRSPASALGADVPISTSVYQQANVPSWLQGSIGALNSEQYAQRAAREDLIDRLFLAAEDGDYNAWEALRSAGLAPGTSGTFVSAIKPPVVAEAESKKLLAEKSLLDERTRAVSGVQRQKNELEKMQLKLNALPKSRGILGSGMQGDPWGRKELEQKIFDLRLSQLKGQDNPVAQVASAAARGTNQNISSWISPVPAMPTY